MYEEEVYANEAVGGRAYGKNAKISERYQGIHLAWNPVRSDDSWKEPQE